MSTTSRPRHSNPFQQILSSLSSENDDDDNDDDDEILPIKQDGQERVHLVATAPSHEPQQQQHQPKLPPLAHHPARPSTARGITKQKRAVTATQRNGTTHNHGHDDDEEDEDIDHDDDDDDDANSNRSSSAGNNNVAQQPQPRQLPPRPSMAAVSRRRTSMHGMMLVGTQTATPMVHRRRRRSSTLFLKIPSSSLASHRSGGGSLTGHNFHGFDSANVLDDNRYQEDGDNNMDDCADDSGNGGPDPANLMDVYKKAIRMNAENKINANNSWSLRLIEHIDKFLMDDDADNDTNIARGTQTQLNGNAQQPIQQTGGSGMMTTETPASHTGGRVNFTKASCTLDASVKIYSYRVDDVHLTSYKVLANLNRSHKDAVSASVPTSTTRNGHRGGMDGFLNGEVGLVANDGNGDETIPDDEDHNGLLGSTRRGNRTSSKRSSTLETNLANINLNKLDAAFDIDPLFSKLSKTFDEGGARGLLLVNLGVSPTGCQIIFDGSVFDENQYTEHEASISNEGDDESTPLRSACRQRDGMIDISSLVQKFNAMLSAFQEHSDENDACDPTSIAQTLETIELVPPLAGLRADYNALAAEGYCNHDLDRSNNTAQVQSIRRGRKAQPYAVPEEEEILADRSIHQEALERSMMGTSRRVLNEDDGVDATSSVRNSTASSALLDTTHVSFRDSMDNDRPIDFGGPYDDGDDGGGFNYGDDLVDLVGPINSIGGTVVADMTSAKDERKETVALLDLLASDSCNLLLHANDYAYLPDDQLLLQDWHLVRRRRRRRLPDKTVSSRRPKYKPAKQSNPSQPALVDLHRIVPNFQELIRLPTTAIKTKGKSRKRATARRDPTQWAAATVTKYTQNEHLIPVDSAALGLEQLTRLFLRPQQHTTAVAAQKSTLLPHSVGLARPVVPSAVGFDDLRGGDGAWIDNDDGGGAYDGGDDDDGGPGYYLAPPGGERLEEDDDEFILPEHLANVRKVQKVHVGYATVAKKVDVKRMKQDLWEVLQHHFQQQDKGNEPPLDKGNDNDDPVVEQDIALIASLESLNLDDCGSHSSIGIRRGMSFQRAVRSMETTKAQADATLPFYFISILHLANEHGLRLESMGLNDFVVIAADDDDDSNNGPTQ